MNHNRVKTLLAIVLTSAFLTGCAAAPTISSTDFTAEKKAPNSVSEESPIKVSALHLEPSSYKEHDPFAGQDLLMYITVKVSAEQMKALPADLSYADILEKLGNTQAFGQPKYRQYVTEDNRIIQLHFESKDDICPYSGEELYDRAMPLKYNGEIPDGMFYGLLVGNGKFVTHLQRTGNGMENIEGGHLNTKDAKIFFEDGTPASEDDLKPETAVFIASDCTLETYPVQMHCTKIVLLK